MITRRLRWLISACVSLAVLLLLVSTATAAETVHLYLKVNGTEIQGESTQLSLGRENSIECVSFDQAIRTPENAGGKAQYGPITCVKRMDRATPLLIKALVLGEHVRATFRFFRPNPTGDGTTEQFYTIEIDDARITGYRAYVPDTIDPNTSSMPPMEQITFTYRSATWTYTGTGASFSTKIEQDQQEPEKSTGYALRAEDRGRGNLLLTWNQPQTDQGRIIGYDLYRSTSATSVVSERNRVLDFPTEKLVAEDRVLPGTYYYVVQAILADRTRLDPSPVVTVVVK